MVTLTQISIYPIKSCGGIDLESSEVEDRGFPLDRRWMLIEEDGTFITQRNTPQLGQIQISRSQDHLRINGSGKKTLTLDLNPPVSSLIQSQIWQDSVTGLWISAECDAWFSEFLDRPVRLIHMNSEVHRSINKSELPHHRSFEVSFADGFPYLLTNLSSLDELNRRLDRPIPMNRFRANLVVGSAEAFAEDHWKRINIGDVEFLVVKPCARCQVVTIDQKSGVASTEPLKTLSTFRKRDGKVMFGMNLIALNSGRVSVMDPVLVLE